MKKKILFFTCVILFILSIVGVSAADENTTFSSLQTEINEAGNSIELTHDYKYDNSTDGQLNQGIIVNKSAFTINGNGHTIDGAGQARIFNIIKDIDIFNLNLVNAFSNDSGGAIFANNDVNLNNVTFENNSAMEGGAVKVNMIYANNCVFNNNYAERGGAISYSFNSYIVDSIFENSHNLTYSLLYGGGGFSGIRIENCTFLNSTSRYATAIYSNKATYIINSTFVNLSSEESAGAILLRGMTDAHINNCTFINVTAVKNGGAIFIDAWAGIIRPANTLIVNTTFINSSGNFGGALVVLGGELTIKDSKFIDNRATFDGAAIYASSVNANFSNVELSSNKLINDEYNGGGAFLIWSNLTVTDSEFLNNTKNAVYAYGCNLTINESDFKDNGVAVHGIFLDYTMNDLNLNDDVLVLNGTDFLDSVSKNPVDLLLINNTIDVTTLPIRFDSRQWGWISSVKNQVIDGSCWAFGTIAALESAILKSTGVEYDFSEDNIKNTMILYSKYGSLTSRESGYIIDATQNLLSWLGPVLEENDTFDSLGKISPIFLTGDNVHVQDAVFVGSRKNLTDNDNIKRAIMKYGSLAIEYYATSEVPDFNNKTSAQYQNSVNTRSHVVSVVGWDDTFSKENFLTTPPGDGAWILKDNFGTGNGDGGYIYLSYYDVSFLNLSYAVGFIFDNTEKYIRNYQTDLSGDLLLVGDVIDISYKNTYESVGDEMISGVGTYFKSSKEAYTINIYVNDVLKHTQNGTGPYYGFHTVQLTQEIPVMKGDNFTVEMTKRYLPLIDSSRQHYKINSTFTNSGSGWEDLALVNKTVSLKVYTKELTIFTEDLVKIYKNDSKFEASVGIANTTVTFEVNGGEYMRITDENGTAKLAINLNPGNYTIKTTFNGTTVENNIEVLPTLIGQNLIKYFRNESQFYISLIDGAGNLVPDVNIAMNINGVFYNRTTNENSTARLNINLAPGEYILTATDPLTGLMMSYNITVLPVLNATDINMSYKDGTQFKAKLVDGTGAPIENASITFNINGVFYTRYTNSSGIAILNINLMAGEYIITSQYENAVIANTIIIRD